MFSEKTHRYIYLFGLCSLAFGMMMGTVPTSVPQFILLGNWLMEGDFKRKWQQLKTNKLFWIVSSLFFAHLFGLIYTQNFKEGLNDIRIKLPLLFLPLIFFTQKSLKPNEFKILLYSFLIGCVANTAWCLIYNFMLHETVELRNASRFMSHIRLGLYLNVAVFCCTYFVLKNKHVFLKILFGSLLIYFVFVLYVLGLITGIFYLSIAFLFTVLLILLKQKMRVKLMLFIIIFLGFTYAIYYVNSVFDSQLKPSISENNKPHKSGQNGNAYLNYNSFTQKENGNFVFINIQPTELKKEWQRRFPQDSFSYMPNPYNLIRYNVILRYMASKGLCKDSVGLTKLTNTDFENIQKNITNHSYPEWSFLHKRIYEFVCEYDEFLNERSINGHSLTMRLYFWKATLQLINKNKFFGVGTGDVQNQLNKTYLETNSPLNKEWFKRPHNQFLTITLSLGTMGLLVFLFSIFYPVIYLRKFFNTLFWPYFLIVILSFIPEDTLETQAGLSFFAFFYSLFISDAFFKKQQNLVD